MDQFEAARLKTAKREAKRLMEMKVTDEGTQISEIEYDGGDIADEIQTTKGKPKRTQDGVFTIAVDMPHAKFVFVLTKPSILSHAPSNRLTESEIRKHIIQGLKPLLGGLE